ncbi:hypothetical protein CMV_011857 [Castanea mollissima]|uniref:Uncharacterized protein n=1 Tax=Castanea mollissima TaxID=60419 RepID=A0A8J4R4I7_9ROSI|nr:hypothetical protein CMV_011857 [Castanea mollissima]
MTIETTTANGSTSSSATAPPLFHLLHGDNYLKILNKFLGQYGHGINHLDSFKIWEVDVAKNELETQKERSQQLRQSTLKAKYTREGSSQFQALNFFKRTTLS